MKYGGKVILLFRTVHDWLNFIYLPRWFCGVLRSDIYFIFTCAAMAVFLAFNLFNVV